MALVYHGDVLTPAGLQVLRFHAGGIPFALPLSSVREIVPVGGPGGGEAPSGHLDLAGVLGLRGEPRFALVLDGEGLPALLVDRMDGVADLAGAEAFRLPERSVEAAPIPFASALRFGSDLYLELVASALEGLVRLPPRPIPVLPDQPPAGPELLAERSGEVIAVPLPLVVQVIDPVRLFPVPLAPAGHRGILHHGRAIHPAWDAAALLGLPEVGDPHVLLLLDAGGATAGVLVDRVVGFAGSAGDGPIRRPPWDVLLAPSNAG